MRIDSKHPCNSYLGSLEHLLLSGRSFKQPIGDPAGADSWFSLEMDRLVLVKLPLLIVRRLEIAGLWEKSVFAVVFFNPLIWSVIFFTVVHNWQSRNLSKSHPFSIGAWASPVLVGTCARTSCVEESLYYDASLCAERWHIGWEGPRKSSRG